MVRGRLSLGEAAFSLRGVVWSDTWAMLVEGDTEQRQRCPGCHIWVDLRLPDGPFYKVLYVMEKHRVIYRVFYVALYVMKKHRAIYRMS